jgi:hypothetical protein
MFARNVLATALLAVVFSWPLSAQTASNRVTAPSPTAASLGQFGDVPVSLYTGTPNIEIPIHELAGRTLSLPISLRYSGGGLKVEDVGGWVGMGWALNAGGVITRTIRGTADEHSDG